MKILIKIGIVVLVLLLISGGIYEYFRLRKREVPVSNAITAIPIDASFIFESHKTVPLWKTVSQASLMWQDLLGTDAFAQLNHNVQLLDSLTNENQGIHTLLEENPLFISAHKNGLDQYGFLFCVPVGGATQQTVVMPYIQSLIGKGQLTQTEYEGTVVYCLKHPGWSDYYFAFMNDIFVSSLQVTLVQESLRQLQSHISLLNNKYFTKVLATSGAQAIANMYINFQALYNVTAPFMSKSFHSTLSSVADFAQWMELDMTFTPNEIVMSGFTDADTTNNQFLSLFSKQSSRPIKITSVVPANTALLSCFEIRDYAAYMKQYKQYLGLHRKISKRTEWMDEVNKKYDVNLEKSFYPWIDGEVALAITEPSDSTMQNDVYAVVSTNDSKDASTALNNLADTVASVQDKKPFAMEYMQHEIKCVDIDNLLPNVLGGTFDLLKKAYYTAIGNYIIFANTPDALQLFINRYEGGNILAKDSYYQSYTLDHVEGESGLFIYNNMALSPVLYEQYLEKPYNEDIKKHSDILRKFQAVTIQMSYMQGMFYTNIYLKRNPQFKKQAGSLWQVALDTTLATEPCWVTDFHTKNKFVFAEDAANNIYLISNTGKIQWKKKTDGKILGGASEVDVMKNGKTQYLFNTDKSINLVDRNGNNVSGYPVKVSATGTLTVFDYDKDKKYRILVPCADNEIREYDVNAKQVDGWAKPKTNDVVTLGANHISIDGKDYIIMVDNGGGVYAFDRKGETRITFKHKLPAHISSFYFNEGTKLSDTYITAADTSGTAYSLSFTDELTKTAYLKESYKYCSYAPVNLDGNDKMGMVFLTPKDVYMYGLNKEKIFHYEAKDTLLNKLFTFVYPDGKPRIGAVEPSNDKVYLWDNAGNLCSGFPLYGAMGFSISDMNNDGQHYLVTGADNAVYVYSLP